MIPLHELLATPSDRMPAVLFRFYADRSALERRFPVFYSPRHREKVGAFLDAWHGALDELPFEEFGASDRLDWLLFKNLLEREREHLGRDAERFAEVAPLLPFATDLMQLEDARRDHTDPDPPAIADRLDAALTQLKQLRKRVEGSDKPKVSPTVAYRTAEIIDRLKSMLADWYQFREGYDPLFTWWCAAPYEALNVGLEEYAAAIRKHLAGAEDKEAIVGDPVGRDALIADLRSNFIPYTPEELIAIGERERQWCLTELRKAAQEMGFGDDYRAAIEAVKNDHALPGQQVTLVRDLAWEATEYVEANDLLTVPELAQDGWRMLMMSPERQKVAPFFLGGEAIIVSFPTDEMDHAWKKMSMRGNNKHFSRATVQHELIPGHYMQSFFQERYRPYRRLFRTPFWIEGWTLHWEMLLWDRNFPRTPQERIGMLFWRLHRCARVVFSLSFHLGQMSPEECVAMLTEEVRHEKENARAEVRRSFQGGYDPLYQAAYLIGGLQVRALHQEVVGSGRLTHRQFHDRFLRENQMPIPALRALLLDLPLERDTILDWRF